MKDRPTTSSSHNVLTIDSTTRQISTSSKLLSDDGELDLSFDEWHQAWRHLLDLIRTYIPIEFAMWEVHYHFILNSDNHADCGLCTLPMMQRFGKELFTYLLICQNFQSVSGMT